MKRIFVLTFLGCCSLAGGAAVMIFLPRLVPSAVAQSQPEKNVLPALAADVTRLGDRFEAVARQVAPAVVYVEATKPAQSSGLSRAKKKPVEESGSGVLIRVPGRRGYLVLTNNHVIAKARPNQITINLADGRLFKPSRVWADPESDVALLALDKAAKLPTAPLGDSDTARVGQWVLAVGSPFGLNQTVTHGIISARERGQVSLGSTIRIKDFLQTDAAINPGSSGGPLVNLRGEVIGINTAIASHSGSNSGVAFSIPINLAKRVMRQLLEKGSVSRGYLGMQLAPSFEPADALKLGLDRVQGAWVEAVYAKTPAAGAGLRVNDVVLRVDNVTIRNENHLINLISSLTPGQKVRLRVWRGKKVVTLEAVIGDWSRERKRFQQNG
jgi:S1-C subfamily serine protease